MFKKVLFTAAAIAAFSACSDENNDNSSNSSNGSGNQDVGKIVKTTIKDVAYIIDKSGGSGGLPSSKSPASSIRAASDGILRFLDNLGQEIAPQFINEQGDTVTSQISIAGMRDLNSDFMILSVSNTGNSDWTTNELLINKKTEATYELNRDQQHGNFCSDDDVSNTKVYTDAQGNIYLQPGYIKIGEGFYTAVYVIYKINTQNAENVTLEEYVPSAEGAGSFIVDRAGVCYYGNFKCPGGRIYTQSQLFPSASVQDAFLGLTGSLYICADDGMYKLSALTNNELAVGKINQRSFSSYLYNPIKQVFLLHGYDDSSGDEAVAEFNEATNDITEIQLDYPFKELSYADFSTSDARYVGRQKLTKISYSDYSSQPFIDFDNLGYKIYSISASSNSPKLSFTAMDYANSNYIMGEIDSNGTVNILDSRNNNGQVWTLTKLN